MFRDHSEEAGDEVFPVGAGNKVPVWGLEMKSP